MLARETNELMLNSDPLEILRYISVCEAGENVGWVVLASDKCDWQQQPPRFSSCYIVNGLSDCMNLPAQSSSNLGTDD